MNPNYKFGLILCTVDRDFSYISSFMKSLLSNTYENWKLIIVDQNAEDKLYSQFIQHYGSLVGSGKIKYLKVDFRGLSRARNYGMRHLSEDVDIVAFPDDDCEYPPDLLDKVTDLFRKYNVDIITGRSIDKSTKMDSNGKWMKSDSQLNLENVWKGAISYTIFIKNKGGIMFDERLGVGSDTEFWSGEETDLLIRLIKRGFKGWYFRDIYVYHPEKRWIEKSRLKHYAMGMGGVFRKNFCVDPYFLLGFLNLMFLRPLGGLILSVFQLNFKMCKFYFLNFLYRWKGFIKWTAS